MCPEVIVKRIAAQMALLLSLVLCSISSSSASSSLDVHQSTLQVAYSSQFVGFNDKAESSFPYAGALFAASILSPVSESSQYTISDVPAHSSTYGYLRDIGMQPNSDAYVTYAGSALWREIRDMCLLDSIAVCVTNYGLLIVDFGDTLYPGELSRLYLPGNCHQLVVSDSFAFVAANDHGIYIVDISNPSVPITVGQYISSAPQWVEVIHNRAYIADWNDGVIVLDISDKTQPILISTYPAARPSTVKVAGQYAYVLEGEYANRSLEVVNIADETQPSHISSYGTFNYLTDLVVLGDVAYVGVDLGKLHIIDLTDPHNLQLLGEQYTGSDDYLADFEISNGYFVMSSYHWTTVNDISNPVMPVAIGIVLGGRCAAGSNGRLAVYDGANISLRRLPPPPLGHHWAPTSSLDLPTGEAQSIAINGDLLFLADGTGGLRILDFSQYPRLQLLGQASLPGIARRVVVSDALAYVVCDNCFSIVDVTEPTQPTIVATQTAEARAIAVQFPYVFVVGGVSDFAVYDVSNQTAPTKVASLPIWQYGWFVGISVAGNYAYLAGKQGGLCVVNITDPLHPTLESHYYCEECRPFYVYDVAVSGTYLVVADSIHGVHMCDISDPSAPVVVGSTQDFSGATNLSIVGPLAFVAVGWEGIRIVDITTPTDPTVVGGYETAGWSYDVGESNQRIFIADGTALLTGRLWTQTAPVIRISETTLDFGSVVIDHQRDLSVSLTNMGLGTLNVTAVYVNSDQFGCTATEFPVAIPAAREYDLTLRFSPNVSGPARANVVIESNDPLNLQSVISVTGLGLAACRTELVSVTRIPGGPPYVFDFGSPLTVNMRTMVTWTFSAMEGGWHLVSDEGLFDLPIPSGSGSVSYLFSSAGSHSYSIYLDQTEVAGSSVFVQAPDLSISSSMFVNDHAHDPDDPVHVGDEVEYRFTLSNNGDGVASNIELTFPIPDFVDFVPGGISGNGQYDPESRSITYVTTTLAAGETVTYGFKITIPSQPPAGSEDDYPTLSVSGTGTYCESSEPIKCSIATKMGLPLLDFYNLSPEENAQFRPGDEVTYHCVLRNITWNAATNSVTVITLDHNTEFLSLDSVYFLYNESENTLTIRLDEIGFTQTPGTEAMVFDLRVRIKLSSPDGATIIHHAELACDQLTEAVARETYPITVGRSRLEIVDVTVHDKVNPELNPEPGKMGAVDITVKNTGTISLFFNNAINVNLEAVDACDGGDYNSAWCAFSIIGGWFTGSNGDPFVKRDGANYSIDGGLSLAAGATETYSFDMPFNQPDYEEYLFVELRSVNQEPLSDLTGNYLSYDIPISINRSPDAFLGCFFNAMGVMTPHWRPTWGTDEQKLKFIITAPLQFVNIMYDWKRLQEHPEMTDIEKGSVAVQFILDHLSLYLGVFAEGNASERLSAIAEFFGVLGSIVNEVNTHNCADQVGYIFHDIGAWASKCPIEMSLEDQDGAVVAILSDSNGFYSPVDTIWGFASDGVKFLSAYSMDNYDFVFHALDSGTVYLQLECVNRDGTNCFIIRPPAGPVWVC